jgi:hypothetical protein
MDGFYHGSQAPQGGRGKAKINSGTSGGHAAVFRAHCQIGHGLVDDEVSSTFLRFIHYASAPNPIERNRTQFRFAHEIATF